MTPSKKTVSPLTLAICKKELHQYDKIKNKACPECRLEYNKAYWRKNKKRMSKNRQRYRKEQREKRTPQYLSQLAKVRSASREFSEKNRERYVWRTMIQRCTEPKSRQYPDYGGRGITVCKRWLGPNGYKNFLADMGKRPTPRHALDRVDNERGYTPKNCEWKTMKEQQRNRRNNIMLTWRGETKCLSEWAEITGMKYFTLVARYKRGWDVEAVLTTPVRSRPRRTIDSRRSL